MNSKFGVFSLFALFPLACAYFNIQNCAEPRYSWLESGLYDAVYLAGRAALTLQQVLDSSDPIPTTVKTILDAFLSSEATRDTYLGIVGKS